MRPISRGAVFWGAALITGGLTVLAIQQGWISDQVVSEAAQWWPLFLIGAGVAIIFAGTIGVIATAAAGVLLGLLVGGLIGAGATMSLGCDVGDPKPLAPYEEGSFSGGGADVRLDLSCASVEVAGGESDRDWSVEVDEENAEAGSVEVSASSNSLEVRTDDTVVFGVTDSRHVGVTVPGNAGTALDLVVNAADANVDLSDGSWGDLGLDGNAMAMFVDLSDAQADSLDVAVNAGSAEIQLSEKTDIGSVTLAVNAGSIEVCAPDGLGIQVTVGANVAASHNLDEAGLVESDGVWRTTNYDSADTRIEISFSGNAASFALNPEGGCS